MAQNNVAKMQTTGGKDIAVQVQPKPTALDKMASRLSVDRNTLAKTLRETAFKGANNEEFVALCIVADIYRLNPLTKEIYAYKAKGGGIVPIVSIDGWIRIANEHPQYDGSEPNHIEDEDGNLVAVEMTIWRKDRTRPTKGIEYLKECYRNTEPWNQMPHRMLNHKAFIQAARYAFGFAGIYTEDDIEMIDVSPARDYAPMPTREQIAHDPETGEVFDEGPADEDHGEAHGDTEDMPTDPQTGMTVDAAEAKAKELIERARSLTTIVDYSKLAEEAEPHIIAMPDAEMAASVSLELRRAKERLTGRKAR